MMKTSLIALLLVAAVSAVSYPRYEEVVRNPKDFDLLYPSLSGALNETWYFSTGVRVTSVIVPSQIFNWGCGAESWTNGTYSEQVDLILYETALSGTASRVRTYLKASGSFNGIANYGQEVHIPLWNSTLNEAPKVSTYVNGNTGYRYTVNIVFKQTGLYPWYTSRALSTYSPVGAGTNTAGMAIGLSYSLS